MRKHLENIRNDVNKSLQKKGKIPRRIFQRLKQVFRPPQSAIDEIKEELGILGWNVCSCSFQADTCIAQRCLADGTSPSETVVISADSDMIGYEQISNIVIPCGKKNNLRLFRKENILHYIGLPSPRHLLLMSIVTTNDYSKGIPWHGVSRNIEIICGLNLAENDMHKNDRVEIILGGIKEYLNEAKGGGSFDVTHFSNAIDAFVACKEEYVQYATPSAKSHTEIANLLQDIYKHNVEYTGRSQLIAPVSTEHSRPLVSPESHSSLRSTKLTESSTSVQPSNKVHDNVQTSQHRQKNRNRRRKRKRTKRPDKSWNR